MTPFRLILQTLTLLGEAVVHPEHGAVPHGAADQLVAPSTICDYELLLVLCSAPSVPQPVVQSRRRPLLGPSPG